MNFPRIGSYNSVRGDGWPLIVNGQLDQTRIAKLARWDDVILDLACMDAHQEIATALKSFNPGIRLHAYVVMQAYAWSGLPFFMGMVQAVESTDGYVRMTNGNMWWFTNINLASMATMDAVAEVIKNYSKGWDGVFLDIFIPKLISANQGNPSGQMEVIDWQRMGFSTEGEFLHAWETGGNRLMALLQGRPLTTNYGMGHPLGNGHMCEDFPKLNGGTWEKNMDGLFHAAHDDPKASWICSGFAGYDHTTNENQRRHRWGLASACLCDGFHSFGRYESDNQWCEARLDWWFQEYQHPSRGRGWLGAPTSAASHVTQSKNKKVDLWTRYFEHGVVVVNPSSKAHSIYFDRPYKPINGSGKTGWSVPANDALILEQA